jgi:hypothetical protein
MLTHITLTHSMLDYADSPRMLWDRQGAYGRPVESLGQKYDLDLLVTADVRQTHCVLEECRHDLG